MAVLDAAGKDVVLVETVGVGQDEVDIVRACHTTVVVSAPGMGDDVQAVKAGILEIADIHVVNNADRPEANRTIRELKMMLEDEGQLSTGGWNVPVLATVAETGRASMSWSMPWSTTTIWSLLARSKRERTSGRPSPQDHYPGTSRSTA